MSSVWSSGWAGTNHTDIKIVWDDNLSSMTTQREASGSTTASASAPRPACRRGCKCKNCICFKQKRPCTSACGCGGPTAEPFVCGNRYSTPQLQDTQPSVATQSTGPLPESPAVTPAAAESVVDEGPQIQPEYCTSDMDGDGQKDDSDIEDVDDEKARPEDNNVSDFEQATIIDISISYGDVDEIGDDQVIGDIFI
eukprot:scaffold509630_cov36-Prasinocladus_malaysianus.AAC.1